MFTGLGLGCATFAVVLGAVGRAFSVEQRTTALGVASVGGAVGIFCSVPITIWLIDQFAWRGAMIGIAALAGTICLVAPFLAGRGGRSGTHQSLGGALR